MEPAAGAGQPAGAARASFLAHQFDTPQRQFRAGKLGMWIFLATEVLMFSGLFCAYAVYRQGHPEVFQRAAQYLNWKLGALNTVVLISSSLTMAWAVYCACTGQPRRLCLMLALTLLLGAGFLGVKAVEYHDKWKHHLLPGARFEPHRAPPVRGSAPPPAAPKSAAATDVWTGPPPGVAPRGLAPESAAQETSAPAELPRRAHVFFGIYFLMTGLHGLHVIAGMIAIAWLLRRARRGDFGREYYTPVDLVGLFWHLVDIIWIYLFPLLYLIR